MILPKEIKYFESFIVEGEDGYQIKLFRVRKSLKSTKPVVLNHALTLSGEQYFDNSFDNLGTRLVEEGYDVWLIN